MGYETRGLRHVRFYRAASLPQHRSAEKAEHLVNRICECSRVISGKEQANRPRIGRYILHKQRSRITRLQEAHRRTVDNNLAIESFIPDATITFLRVGQFNSCIQPGNPTARQAGCASTFLHVLIQGGPRCIPGNCSNLENGAVRSDHTRTDPGDRAIDIRVWKRIFLHQRANRLRESPIATHVDQPRLNDGITRLSDPIVAAKNGISFKHVVIAKNLLVATDFRRRPLTSYLRRA
jgi:hypothetical protein